MTEAFDYEAASLCGQNHDPSMISFARKCIDYGKGQVVQRVELAEAQAKEWMQKYEMMRHRLAHQYGDPNDRIIQDTGRGNYFVYPEE